MQELYIQDELVDYNDPLTPPPSNSPAQSPLALDSDTEEGDERRQEEEAARIAIEQERKAVEDAATKRRETHLKEVEILTNRLTDNGWKMRMKVWADPGQTFRPTPMTAPTKPEEIITNTGSILYGIQPDWLVPDKHIQLPD